jgi:hypothetical protein
MLLFLAGVVSGVLLVMLVTAAVIVSANLARDRDGLAHDPVRRIA